MWMSRHWRRPESCIFKFTVTGIITAWRTHKLQRWKRHQLYLMMDPELMYGNKSSKNIRLFHSNVFAERKAKTRWLPSIFISGFDDDKQRALRPGVWNLVGDEDHKHTYILQRVEPLLCNDCDMGGYTRAVSGQWLGKHVPSASDTMQ
jgi:hypothetical protein